MILSEQTRQRSAENEAELFPPENKQMSAVAKREEPAALEIVTPADMLDRALQTGNVEIIAKVMDLYDRAEAARARKAFDLAIADAKREIPVIIKNREGHNQKRYADFAALARAVDPVLSKFGLSYRFRTNQDDKIHVTCILSHSGGHSEETTLSGPADKTGAKNDIQAIGSTLTYLQRYSLTQALGLAASEDDDGKAGGTGETIAEDQIEWLRSQIVEIGADLPGFLNYMGVAKLEEIPARDMARAQNAINAAKRNPDKRKKPNAS